MFPYFLICLSSLLAILAHPFQYQNFKLPNLGFLAFVAYVPLLFAIQNATLKQIFRRTFLSAFLFYLGSLYWLYTALHNFGGLAPSVSLIVQIILSAILAAYFSLPFVLYKKFFHKEFTTLWLLPLLILIAEYCRNYWPLGGFPWGQVGYTQAQNLRVLQFADLFGVYGITLFIWFFNVWIFSLIKRKINQQKSTALFLLGVLSTSLLLLYGEIQVRQYKYAEHQQPGLKVSIIQGNVHQDDKWDERQSLDIVRRYQNLSLKAFEEGASLVIWPETAYPLNVPLDQHSLEKNVLFDSILNADSEFPRAILSGAISFEKDRFYNSALLLSSFDSEIQSYHKQKLVPYGEYVPLKEYLPFLDKLTEQVGSFYSGDQFHPLNFQSLKLGALICYEDIFPQVARQQVNAGANALVNLTNDAWYGLSSALPQHLNFSVFRAVENRRMLVRATNTGASAFIHSWGALESELPYEELAVGKAELKVMELQSVYTRWGDVLVKLCVSIVLIVLLLIRFNQNTLR